MPIYVTLGNWTDQGTKDFGGAVERANGFVRSWGGPLL
jgi:uncharacterized protein with GYD domain